MNSNELSELLKSWDNLRALLKASEDASQIHLLVCIATDDSKPEHWRAAWLIDKANETDKNLLLPHLPDIYASIRTIGNYSHIRHFLRIINTHPIPEDEQIPLFDLCINLFSNNDIPVAVRANAMELAYSIVKLNPELHPEMKQLLEFILEQYSSAGIRAKAKNLLTYLSKIQTTTQ